MTGEALSYESQLDQVKKELEKKSKENSTLNKRMKELIEESERIGEESCQVAQVQQVESAAMGYEFMIAEEKVISGFLMIYYFFLLAFLVQQR